MVDCINEIRLVVATRLGVVRATKDAGRAQRLYEDRAPAAFQL